jgi:hypothetical protein
MSYLICCKDHGRQENRIVESLFGKRREKKERKKMEGIEATVSDLTH